MHRKRKIRVGIIFGGKSAEHEVSLQSAKNVIAALDGEKYTPVLIGIDKKGKWHRSFGAHYLLRSENPKLITLNKRAAREVGLLTGTKRGELLALESGRREPLDVVFPVLHGPFGEDGTVQGLLKLLDIPFVGPSVLGSAVGMDKEVQKRLLRERGIPIAKYVLVLAEDKGKMSFSRVTHAVGLPFFVKPANAGSSVGVYKVKNESEFEKAMGDAARYDRKILLEEAIEGREIECAVLGNEHPIASVPGEVKPAHEFYSYEAKYIDEDGAAIEIPADLPPKIVKKVREMALQSFRTLECEGMARVDMFVEKSGRVLVNEINTIPGFTKISMYPKLFEASGIPYPKLIDILIQLALKRHAREKRLKTSF